MEKIRKPKKIENRMQNCCSIIAMDHRHFTQFNTELRPYLCGASIFEKLINCIADNLIDEYHVFFEGEKHIYDKKIVDQLFEQTVDDDNTLDGSF